jgi:hypothetical protein
MGNPKFTIFRGKDGSFRFRLEATNGEIILKSEGYTQKHNAQKGIASVRANAARDARFRRIMSESGEVHFNLTAANGEVIASSETYSSEQALETGIASVKNNAPEAITEDLTR